MMGLEEAAAEAVTARGASLRDRFQAQNGVMNADGASFNPEGAVSRGEMAYTLVQALGMESEAEAARVALENQPITAARGDERVALDDDAAIPAHLRGYVQLALDLQLMRMFQDTPTSVPRQAATEDRSCPGKWQRLVQASSRSSDISTYFSRASNPAPW